MKDQRKILKLAMSYYAVAALELELNDQLKGTVLYRQKLKSLLKSLLEENEKIYKQILTEMKEDAEIEFYKVIKMVELFVKVIEDKDFDTTIALLEEYQAGSIAVIGEGKHKKMYNQLEKI
jgi:hypothetical protein